MLVGVDFGPGSPFDPTLDELALLAESAGERPVARLTARRKSPDPALFVGSGQAAALQALVDAHKEKKKKKKKNCWKISHSWRYG